MARLLLVSLALVGCGTSNQGASDASAPVMCTASPPAFPSFDRGCTVAADCAIVMHQTTCCGDERVMGIAASESTRFASAEAICESQYPGCGCAAGPPIADDGSMPSGLHTTAVVLCLGGECTTAFGM